MTESDCHQQVEADSSGAKDPVRNLFHDTAPPGLSGAPDLFAATTSNDTAIPSGSPFLEEDTLTHERARSLLCKQRDVLLPPADANALAQHLLDCDFCYRYAQDVAAQRRNADAH